MSVRFALLGLLREQPDYGYRLKKRFEERVGNVWRLNIGQVYQTLHSLETAGLVRRCSEAPSQNDDQDPVARRQFELTPKGVRMLESWVRRTQSSPQPVRDELLIRLLVLEPERRADALERIEAQKRVYKKYMTKLLSQKRKLPRRDSGSELVASLGLEAALFHTAAHIRWLDYATLKLGGAGNGDELDPEVD